jgi:hypothetical protein
MRRECDLHQGTIGPNGLKERFQPRDPAAGHSLDSSMTCWSNRPEAFAIDPEALAERRYRLLCEDQNGVYALPFPCESIGGVWVNVQTRHSILTEVIGWREWDDDGRLN